MKNETQTDLIPVGYCSSCHAPIYASERVKPGQEIQVTRTCHCLPAQQPQKSILAAMRTK